MMDEASSSPCQGNTTHLQAMQATRKQNWAFYATPEPPPPFCCPVCAHTRKHVPHDARAPLLQVSMTFKNHQVLKDCSWEVKKGERVGLVGEYRITRDCKCWHVCHP